MKGKDSGVDKYPTLDSYLRGEFWTYASKLSVGRICDNYDKILETFGQISQQEDANIQYNCYPMEVRRLLRDLEDERDANPQFYRILRYNFEQYLQKCGYEGQYQKAIARVNWNVAKFPTLDSYLVDEFYVGWRNISWFDEHQLARTLSLFKEFSEPNKLDYSKMCREYEVRFKIPLILSKRYSPQLFELWKLSFPRYLNECGYEQKYKRATSEYNVATDGGDSPFFSYLLGKYLTRIEKNRDRYLEEEIMFALEVVDNLIDSDRMKNGEIICPGTHLLTLAKQREKAKVKQYNELRKCLDGVYADYVKVCASELKVKAKELEQNNDDGFAFVKQLAKEMETKIRTKHRDDHRTSRQIIKDDLLSVDVFKSTDKLRSLLPSDTTNELKRKCQSIFQHLLASVEAMSYDFCEIKQDHEIMDIMNSIGYCFYREVNKEISVSVLSMFYKLDAPYYPTKAAVPTIQPNGCRRL